MFKEQLQTKVTRFWFLKLCFSKLCIEVKPPLSRKIFPVGISSVQYIYFREPSTWNTNNDITCNHSSRTVRITFDPGVFFEETADGWFVGLLQPLVLNAGLIRGVDIRGSNPRLVERGLLYLSDMFRCPRREDVFEALSMQSLLHRFRELSVISGLRAPPEHRKFLN